jgi:hypothetical protein
VSDLRGQLAAVGLCCACDAAWTDRKLHAPDCLEEVGDDAVAAVAQWLRSDATVETAARALYRGGLWDELGPRYRGPYLVTAKDALSALADGLAGVGDTSKPVMFGFREHGGCEVGGAVIRSHLGDDGIRVIDEFRLDYIVVRPDPPVAPTGTRRQAGHKRGAA